MLRNVCKMTVVRLLLCSVLLYNTEALDYWYDETPTDPVSVTVPKTSDWYYESDTVHNNGTQNYEIEPEKDKRPPSSPDNKTTDWYYGSNDKSKPRHNEFPSLEDPKPALSNVTSYLTDAKVVKPNNDDVGYLTVDNGILTAHGLTRKDDDKENNSDKVGWSNDGFSDIVKKTSNATRPYKSYWYDKVEDTKTRTETPYYKYNNSVVDYETVSQPAKPYYWYGDKENIDDRNKTAVHYGYNIPVVNFETTTTRRPYYAGSMVFGHWDKQFEVDKSKTAVPYYVYNKTAKESETTTTRRSHYWWTGTKSGVPNNVTVPSYGYDKTAKEYETTTTIRPRYWWTGTKSGVPNNVTVPFYGYDKTAKESGTTTKIRPYDWWTGTKSGVPNNVTVPSYGYDKTAKEYETTTTIRPRYWWTGTKLVVPNSVTLPSYRYYKTVEKSKTTTAEKSITPVKDPRYYGTKSPPDDVAVTPRKPVSTAHVNYTWAATVSPVVNETNSLDVTTDKVNPKTPNSRLNPVNISINSTINENEPRNYGSFADLLKKMAGNILPYTSNIAPNSSITNLAVANGNGNVFFYVG